MTTTDSSPSHRHFFHRLLISAALLVAVSATQLRAQETNHYLPADNSGFITLLAPPPLPDSAEQKYDLAEVRAVHEEAPTNETAAALAEDKGVSMFFFTPDVGDIFRPGKLPVTEAFLRRVHQDAEHVVDASKNYWKRPRPYVVDPGLVPGKLGKSFSYPSGHSTESMTLALVLAELFPDKRDALVAEARTIGWHRVEIARHYPTDIYAGRVLAQAIVREMKNNPDFQKDLAKAKAEIAAAQAAAKN